MGFLFWHESCESFASQRDSARLVTPVRLKGLVAIDGARNFSFPAGVMVDMQDGNSGCLGRAKGACYTRDTPTHHYADFQRLDISAILPTSCERNAPL